MGSRHLTRRLAYLAAVALTASALFEPAIPIRVPSATYLFVFDVSLSMQVEDAGGISRLEAAKAMVRAALPQFPPGARVAVGAFAGGEIQILLEPIPVQEQLLIEQALALVRTDNAWATGSHVWRAVDELTLKATTKWGLPEPLNVFFFTDGGDEAPPPSMASFIRSVEPARVRLTLVGMGNTVPSPVPPARSGRACLEDPRTGQCFSSALNEPALVQLASIVGGRYARASEYAGREVALFRKGIWYGDPTRMPYPLTPWLVGAALLSALASVVR